MFQLSHTANLMQENSLNGLFKNKLEFLT